MKNEETLLLFAKAIKSLIKTQPLDKITVTDIVFQAGKTRQTFYRHFQDKYDLVNWYFEKLVLKSFEEMNQGGSLQEALNLKFAFIEQEHAFFKEAFKSNDYNNLIHYDFCCIYDFYKKFIEPALNSETTSLNCKLQCSSHLTKVCSPRIKVINPHLFKCRFL